MSADPAVPLAAELEACGWRPASPDRAPEAVLLRGRPLPAALFAGARGETLFAADLTGFEGSTPDSLFPRFLDFGMETRLVLEAALALGGAGRVLIRRGGAHVLHRLPPETIEAEAATEEEALRVLLPPLAARAKGGAERWTNPPESAAPSRELRGWITHWGREFSAALEAPPEDCERFVWKFVLVLQAHRKRPEIRPGEGARWGLTVERKGREWRLGHDASGAAEGLAAELDRFDRLFSTRIFSGDATMHRAWLETLDETPLPERFRAELLMQAKARFEAEAVAWLYSPFEAEQEGWRLEIGGAPPLRTRMIHEGWQVIEPLRSEPGRHGLTSLLRDFDRLAAYWADYAAYRETADSSAAPGFQPDLFLTPPRGVDGRGRLTDGLNFIFAHSLRLPGVEAKDEFGAGLALLLKALSAAERHDWPLRGIDALDRIWPEAG